jgi:putative protease
MKKEKPELLISAASVPDVERYFRAGADAVNIGNEQYALRMPGSFSLTEIQESVAIARRYQGKVYVSINALLHHEMLSGLEEYIQQLQAYGVDAIVFGDPAVLMAVRQVAPGMRLHWNTETTSTNYHTVNYWASKGASRAVLARELSLEDVIEIKRKTSIEIQAQIHGMTCIFHSKRELVSNFLRYKGMATPSETVGMDRGLFLKEEKRQEQKYPIFEDVHGTHIMSAEDICMLEHLHAFLQAGIDSLKIEGILKSVEYNETVVSIYRTAIDHLLDHPEDPIDPKWIEEIRKIQPANRPYGTCFYFKEQIY